MGSFDAMAEDEERLRAEAEASREETRRLREEAAEGGEGTATRPPDDEAPDDGGEPWAKTSSGDTESP